MGKSIDLIGMRFGKLIVIKKTDKIKNGNYYWLCKCDCGLEKEVLSTCLRYGDTKSCGCYRSEYMSNKRSLNLLGRRFGRLLVLSKSSKKGKGGQTYWVCLCDCGNKKEIVTSSLINGNSTSCSCYVRELLSKANKIEYGLASKNALYKSYMGRANRKGISFDLSFEEFLNLVQQKCFYCDSEPENIAGNRKYTNGSFVYNGIDRVDNTRGYTIENCVPCCEDCNRAKNSRPQREFIEWGKKLGNHLNNMEEKNESTNIFGARERVSTNDSCPFFC